MPGPLIGDDQPAVLRKKLGRDIAMRGEKQPVTVLPVFGPLAIRAEILDRGLDLDDPDLAIAAKRHEIGTTAGGKRQFRYHRQAQIRKQPLNAPAHEHCAIGLPSVDERVSGMWGNDCH
jgi:hypothetical protein